MDFFVYYSALTDNYEKQISHIQHFHSFPGKCKCTTIKPVPGALLH
jgi:hypothetical protein